MDRELLPILACPACKGTLLNVNTNYACGSCRRSFVKKNGITWLLGEQRLHPQDRYIQKIYNGFSRIYDLFLPPLFALSGLRERTLREAILAPMRRLQEGAILEVSVGTGANLPLLRQRAPSARMVGVDLSLGMLQRCEKNLKRWQLEAELFHANASALPFQDDQFDLVLHVGGINSFADKKSALDEMFRVVKPGGQVIINDEGLSPNMRKRWRSRIFFNLIFGLFASLERGDTEPPMDLLPARAKNIRLDYIGKDYFWLLQFQK